MANSRNARKNAFRELHAAIDDFISRQGNKTFNYKQVAHALGIDTQTAAESCGNASCRA